MPRVLASFLEATDDTPEGPQDRRAAETGKNREKILRAIWLAASTILIFSPGINAASNPIDDGQNDDPSARLIFAVDPFAEPIGYSILNGDAKERVLSRFGKPIDEEVVSAVSLDCLDARYQVDECFEAPPVDAQSLSAEL